MIRCAIYVLLLVAQFSQSRTGELRVLVKDQNGLPLESQVALTSEANQFGQSLATAADGTAVARRLPFGRYRIEISSPGFANHTSLIDVQSALPIEYRVTLTIAPLQSQVTVTPTDTLLDTRQTGSLNRVGLETIQSRVAALPGRSVAEVVNTAPGWLLEANGVLHPRGSEYQVQYVIDGLPLTDNRSPSFATDLDADTVHAMNIITGGYPAEYGRKLGGVVEVVTAGDARSGFHGGGTASLGSFGTRTGSGEALYGWNKASLGASGSLTSTDRYLDPPVEENFTNSGTGANVAVHFEEELSASDRIGLALRYGHTRFSVPNERLQEEAGQRQQRSNAEIAAQFSYQRLIATNLVGDVRGMVRTLSAVASSNQFATPIAVAQNRGFTEGYVKAALTGRAGVHEWKAGFDIDYGRIREAFAYRITDPSFFDPTTAQSLAFDDRRSDREHALFVQDRVSLGAWTISAGLRFDHYHLVVDDSAISPRLAVAWSWPAADLVVRASYDRAFQTPALENLLLASSPELDAVRDDVARLPVSPSVGNFLEAGLSKRLFSALRLDIGHFRRSMTNFADDDVMLNTGISFPIAFAQARVTGTEVKLEVPRWRAVTASAAYTHMVGTGRLPITGGLLLGDDAAAALASTDEFPISQDQRHTLRWRGIYHITPRVWAGAAASYGSGLPVEFTGDRQQAVALYGQRIVDRVDLGRGRLRPSASLDASGSIVIAKSDRRSVRLQADVINVTNRLNVINFAGLFSGTAIAPPRSVSIRVQAEF